MALPVHIPAGSRADIGWRVGRVVLIALLVFATPYLVPSFRLSQITGALVLAIAVVGLNLLSGFAGQISLGHAAFFGIGAYTTGVMTVKWETAVPITLVVGMVLCFVVGVLVGLPALRLQGMYLALVTLAVGVLLPSLIRRFDGLTGGSSGLFGMEWEPPGIAYFAGRGGETVWLYYVTVVALVLACVVVWNVMHSRIGRAVVALRDNEAPAIMTGINRAFVRTVVFGLSASIAGLAGGIFAVQAGILTPEAVSLLLTINLLVAMIIGGRASYWGPVFGAFVIYFVPVWTSDLSQGPISGVLFGALVILLVFVMPNGLAGGLTSLVRRVVVVVPQPPRGATEGPSPVPVEPGDPAAGNPPLEARLVR
ncbi:branched-chain amino acid ABC transporter permease [Nocardioides sp. LHD-245]|uniref:branched-chain amino acid ABC transporter permease n=1 Tax=Nocardioides sp. LHD-245 TaxID=3051387 RepID=UPI0027E0F37A|nr:branched-chain amino acid ABC transporter permease [Nocardioides sp. LHD-245]